MNPTLAEIFNTGGSASPGSTQITVNIKNYNIHAMLQEKLKKKQKFKYIVTLVSFFLTNLKSSKICTSTCLHAYVLYMCVFAHEKEVYLTDAPQLDSTIITPTGKLRRAYNREVNRPSPLLVFSELRKFLACTCIP